MKIYLPKRISGNLVLALFLLFFVVNTGFSQQNKTVSKVEKNLLAQAKHWNTGNINAFMQYYWKSPNLQFVGSRGVTFGWQQTLENYQKSYPDKQAMGQLSFEIIKADQLSRKVILMSGKFMLDRQGLDNLEGHFLLVWKKIKGKWLIIADHTS